MSQHSTRASPSMPSISLLLDMVLPSAAGAFPSPLTATVCKRVLQVPAMSCGPSPSGTSPRTTRSQTLNVRLDRLPSQSIPHASQAALEDLYPTNDQVLPRAGPVRSGGGQDNRYATMDSTRLARPEGCCDRHTPMSVRSMGLTSSGHPRAGPGGPTGPLRHWRLRIVGSGRMPLNAPPAVGPNRVRGPLAGGCGSCGPTPVIGTPAARSSWDVGAVSGPRAELDIGADKRTST
jgi:hypothetical protein